MRLHEGVAMGLAGGGGLAALHGGVSSARLCPPDQTAQVEKPRIAADMLLTTGGVPGAPPTDRQRVTYRTYRIMLTNNGSAPIRGWNWEISIAPELRSRLIRAEQSIDPDPESSPALPVWHPGETFKITGYLDLNTEGLSKQYLEAVEPVVIRIMDADGREIFRFPRKLTK